MVAEFSGVLKRALPALTCSGGGRVGRGRGRRVKEPELQFSYIYLALKILEAERNSAV